MLYLQLLINAYQIYDQTFPFLFLLLLLLLLLYVEAWRGAGFGPELDLLYLPIYELSKSYMYQYRTPYLSRQERDSTITDPFCCSVSVMLCYTMCDIRSNIRCGYQEPALDESPITAKRCCPVGMKNEVKKEWF